MRRLLFIGLCLLPSMCFGQSLLRVQKFCEVGNQSVTTQGLASLTKVQRSFPLCLVTVYQSGTTNKASLFSDNLPVPSVLANPFTANVDGSFGFYAAPGACYDVVTSGAGFPNPFTYSYICLNSGGGGGSVNCPTALNGSMAAFTSPTGLSCDQNFFTDFAGNFTAQSGSFIGPVNGFTTYIGGGSAPGTQVKYKLPANAFRILAPSTVGTPYYFVPPSVRCSVGQVWGLASETTDANGDKVDTYQCQTSVAAGTEVQVNGVDTTAQTPITFNNTPSVIFANPSAGVITATAVAGSTQASNPIAPTLTTNGSAGATSDTYGVVGCEDVNCVYHSAFSGTTTISTANATLTSSNSVNIKTYADTLYGYRFYKVCRTASGGTPSTTGVIYTGAGKALIDTGLAGDSTNCASTYASNTTSLDQHCLAAALPAGLNVMPGAPCGQDAPPTSPNALDDEFTHGTSIGTPGDVNDGVWQWGNQGTATASWSGGTLILNPDTTNAYEYLTNSTALPATPYTFTAYLVGNAVNSSSGSGDGCFIGLRESATGKLFTAEILYLGPNVNTEAAQGGWVWNARNSTSNTPGGTVLFQSYETSGAYVTIQNTGTNIVMTLTPAIDGVNFLQWQSQSIATIFTTAPNQLVIGGLGPGGGKTTCTFDFVRRTQ